MKRFLLKLTVLALVVVGCLVLATACGGAVVDITPKTNDQTGSTDATESASTETAHVHTFSEEWTIDLVPTCAQEGSKSHHCTECGEKKDITVLAKVEHSFGDWETVAEASCATAGSKKRTCSVCNTVETETLSADHLFDRNGLCTVCKYFDETKAVTEGLVFEYSTDYDGYICKGFDEDSFGDDYDAFCYYLSEKKVINIPETYDDGQNGEKSVVGIGERAFLSFSEDAAFSVIYLVPDSVKFIEERAFYGVNGKVTVGKNVMFIGEDAFEGQGFLEIYNRSSLPIEATCYTNQGEEIECKVYTDPQESLIDVTDGWITYSDGEDVVLLGSFIDEKDVRIPSNITKIGGGAYCYNTSMTYLTIPNSVKEIESFAISFCPNLKIVSIGNGVTRIGALVFYACSGLTKITIPDSVTSIDMYTLDECDNLTYNEYNNGYYLGNEKNKYVVLIDVKDKTATSFTIHPQTKIILGAFDSCGALTSITIPNSVTSIGAEAFKYCDGLTSINIPDNVTNIGGEAFRGCNGLTSVIIGSEVKSIGDYAFSGCSKLVEVYNKSALSITKGSVDYGYAGYYAKNIYTPSSGSSKLSTDNNGYIIYTDGEEKILMGYTGEETDLTIPTDITKIYQDAFYKCSGLTSVIIPDSVTSIGYDAFYNCSGLTSVTIGSNVTSIGDYAFYGCYKLVEVYNKSALWISKGFGSNGYVGNYAKEIYTKEYVSKLSTDSNGYIIYTDGEEKILIGYTKKNTNLILPTEITSIYQYAFSECSNLTSVTIGNNVTSIGDYAFYNCSRLKSVTIGSKVESIGSYAFYRCNGLETITVSAGNASYHSAGNCLIETASKELVLGCKNSIIPTDGSVESIGEYAFYGCSGLKKITIPDSVKSIGSHAFCDCSGLTSVTIGSKVESIGDYAFSWCSGLTSIIIPDSVTSINSYAFYDCSGLTSVVIGSKVESIGFRAFGFCEKLTSIIIPDSVTSIGGDAFYGCSGLTSIIIPDSVTSIAYDAFNWCSRLTTVIIGSKVESIGSGAFSYCNKLTSVTFKNTSGWYVSTSSTATSGTDVTVTDPSTNATYLKSTYRYYYWKR